MSVGVKGNYITPGYYDVKVTAGHVSGGFGQNLNKGQIIENYHIANENQLKITGNDKAVLSPAKFKKIKAITGNYQFVNRSGNYIVGTDIAAGTYLVKGTKTEQPYNILVESLSADESDVMKALQIKNDGVEQIITLPDESTLKVENFSKKPSSFELILKNDTHRN